MIIPTFTDMIPWNDFVLKAGWFLTDFNGFMLYVWFSVNDKIDTVIQRLIKPTQ